MAETGWFCGGKADNKGSGFYLYHIFYLGNRDHVALQAWFELDTQEPQPAWLVVRSMLHVWWCTGVCLGQFPIPESPPSPFVGGMWAPQPALSLISRHWRVSRDKNVRRACWIGLVGHQAQHPVLMGPTRYLFRETWMQDFSTGALSPFLCFLATVTQKHYCHWLWRQSMVILARHHG